MVERHNRSSSKVIGDIESEKTNAMLPACAAGQLMERLSTGRNLMICLVALNKVRLQ
jgi:hypothetical protein